MSEAKRTARPLEAPGVAFWEGVEREIEALDVFDLIEFMGAGSLPIESRPGFERDLEARLRAGFRRRYCQ